jgi:DNA-binding beta-propeller fold protein YncE
MRKSRWYRAGPLALLLAGCGGDPATESPDLATPGADLRTDPAPDLTTAPGDMAASLNFQAAPATTGGSFTLPLDSVPSPDGKTFYFTARGMNGAGVFKVAASGGAATEIFSGDPLVSPTGIAIGSDGTTLFIADPGVGDAMNDGKGAVFTLAAGGGMPAMIGATFGFSPRSLDVLTPTGMGADSVWFSGVDAADGKPGVFKMGAGGAGLAAVAKGDPFRDPGGVAVTAAGSDLYVADTLGEAGSRLIKVSGGAAAVFLENVPVGYPAGIALTRSEAYLAVSGQDRDTGMSVVYIVNLASKAITTQPIVGSSDSGGLHRARMTDEMSWIDNTGAMGRGNVVRVTLF